MSPQLQQAAGSPLWQLVLVSFALVLILFEVVRGWRRGLPRQLARLAALIGAYLAAYFGGPLVAPFIAPFVHIPDFAMSILVGAVFAVVVYAIISGLGTMLFRRTGQHNSAFVRLIYGVSGAVLGIFFGAFLVWMVCVGIRALGALAETPAHQQAATQSSAASPRALHAVDVRRGVLNDPSDEPSVLMSLARLKNSLEMGALGDMVKRADVVPANTYETLGKLGQVVSSPERAERFLSFPGAREVSEHPRIAALRDDPEISKLIEQGRFLDLLQNRKIVDALNDGTLLQQIKKFDLQRALDYAIQEK
ncbi:MAG: CvpA family protein [Spartobacteria bacterium]